MPRKPAAKKPTAKKPAKKPAAKKKPAVKKPPASARARRLEHKRKAAEALEHHSGPVLNMLASVIHDLADEAEGESVAAQDLLYCMELSHRLDKAIKLNDPILEALDGLVIFFVSAAAVGIYRAIEGATRHKSRRLARLKDRLASKGPRMGAVQRKRLERRIARLEG